MRAIDADAFKNYIREASEDLAPLFNDNGKVARLITENFCKDIDEQPTIQPEPHWIPVEQDLPKDTDPVNVTWVNRNPEVYYMDIKDKPFTATAHYYKGRWYWYSSVTQDLLDEYGDCESELVDKDVEITAWMPLPESYKGVAE